MSVDARDSQVDDLSNAQRGQSAAFASLVRGHQAAVYSLALRMLGDRELARDLAQEVFLQLYRKLSHIESARHLTFWLRKVTTNMSIDRLRQLPDVKFALLEEGEQVAGEVAEHDPLLQQQLRAHFCELPAAARAVMLLRYQEDLDPTDIAATMNMSINTVKSHLKRSLAFMRQRMAAVSRECREAVK